MKKLIVSFATVVVAALSSSGAMAPKPNIVVILADDLGYADVGFNGCKDIPTPNIDSLAKHGVRCSNGYVSHPFCSPTRAGLMTGRYQQRFGHENNPTFLPEDTKVGLPLNQITVAQSLKDAGYKTIAVGKWHLGAAPCFHPNERGFTDYFGFLGGGHQYMSTAKGSAEYSVPLLRNKEPLEHTEYMTDVLSREAAAYIRKYKSQPFYLYLAYNAVHTPLQAPEKYLNRFPNITDERRRTYAAMNSAMDDGIGLVLQALRENNLEQNTLIFFFSDNGGPPYTVAPTHNDPLRGNKGQVYEGGIHVPFVVQWLGRLPEGKVFDEPVCSIDVFPTAAALAGAKVPSDRKIDGVNLMPYLLGEKSGAPHERLHWRTGGGTTWAVREGRYKLVKMTEAGPELYDLQADIGETKNIASEKPDVAKRLLKAHDDWNAELVPPIFESPGAGQAKKKKTTKAKAIQ